MGYAPAMKRKLLFVLSGMLFLAAAAPRLRADQLEMQNGDRYSGKVLSVSADTVVLDSEMLGKINVPRKKVVRVAFGTNTVAPFATAGSAPVPASANPAAAAPANTNADFRALLHNPGTNADVARQIREQMLAGSPEATAKFNDMVSSLMTGQMDMNDLRRQAQSAADQLRAVKRDLGPDAGDTYDAYLEVLDNFLKEVPATNAATAPPPEPQTP